MGLLGGSGVGPTLFRVVKLYRLSSFPETVNVVGGGLLGQVQRT